MKWKEFKETVESQGVTDDSDIKYIDTDFTFDIDVDTDDPDWITITDDTDIECTNMDDTDY